MKEYLLEVNKNDGIVIDSAHFGFVHGHLLIKNFRLFISPAGPQEVVNPLVEGSGFDIQGFKHSSSTVLCIVGSNIFIEALFFKEPHISEKLGWMIFED